MTDQREFGEPVQGNTYWKPTQDGEEIVGKVKNKTEGDYGNQWTLLQDNGEEITTPSHAVLQSRMEKTKIGDIVKITYKGQDSPKIKGQQGAQLYEVRIAK